MGKPKERPILFNGEMVRAILGGRKTMTRRPVKPQPDLSKVETYCSADGSRYYGKDAKVGFNDSPDMLGGFYLWIPGYSHGIGRCPFGQPGDRLWVREAWATSRGADGRLPKDMGHQGWPVWYRADDSVRFTFSTTGGPGFMTRSSTWRPSIHMPRWACRLVREVTAVRVDRLQDISEEDAIAEGVEWDDWEEPLGEGYCTGSGFLNYQTNEFSCSSARDSFRTLWISVYGAESWDRNDWVWVVEFRRLSGQAEEGE